MSRPQASIDLSFRIGAASLGMFAGLALGAIIGVVTLDPEPWILGAMTAGVISGLLFPAAAIDGAELTLHFIIGLIGGGAALTADESPRDAPGEQGPPHDWLRIAAIFGAVFAVVVALLHGR